MKWYGFVLMALAVSTAFAGVDARLVGSWQSPQATLKIEANGRCTVNGEVGKCQTLRSALFYSGPNGALNTYGFRIKDDELTISGGGQVLVFRRVTETAAQPPAAQPAPASPPAPGAPAAPAAGRWAHPYWGLEFAPPPGWKVAEREGNVLLGSDTEPGLMLARFMPGANRQMLLQGYGEGLKEEGVTLMPSARAEDFKAGANAGVAGELAGMAQNGSQLKARVIGVLTPFGDAAVFMGITTADKYAGLKPRVDALAASAGFTRPKIPPANVAVAGQYFYYYSSNLTSVGGSNYSREDSLSLCSNGMFRRKGETYAAQPNQWNVYGQGGYAGSWAADGDGQNGTITLTYANGRVERLRYQKSGPDIVLNGRKYGRNGDGSCAR